MQLQPYPFLYLIPPQSHVETSLNVAVLEPCCDRRSTWPSQGPSQRFAQRATRPSASKTIVTGCSSLWPNLDAVLTEFSSVPQVTSLAKFSKRTSFFSFVFKQQRFKGCLPHFGRVFLHWRS